MGKKGKMSEADKAAKREEQEAERAVQAVLALCNKEEDIFTRFAGFKKRKAKDFEIHFTYFKRAQDMGKEVLAWAFDLTKKNMEAIYNATTDMKWNDKLKKSELSDATARFILLTRGPIEATADAKADESKKAKISPSQCVGFVHIRFENEGGPTLYIYEFQLDKSIQRQGVGKFCVGLLELLAWKSDLDQVMLTVQQTNKEALAFYHKMKYVVHESDPGSSSYSLLTKPRPASLAKTVPVPAAPSKQTQEEDEEEDDDFVIDEEEDDEGDEGDEGDGEAQPDLGEMIREVMSQQGPIVTVVIVEPDGRVVEQEVDMTPKKDTPGTILGGGGTFLGQYEDDPEAKAGEGSVVTVMMRGETKGLPLNKGKLPPPLDKEQAYGRVLLIRMDGQAMPQNFTKAEFEALNKKSTTTSSATATSTTTSSATTTSSTIPSAASLSVASTEATAEPVTVIHASPAKKDHGKPQKTRTPSSNSVKDKPDSEPTPAAEPFIKTDSLSSSSTEAAKTKSKASKDDQQSKAQKEAKENSQSMQGGKKNPTLKAETVATSSADTPISRDDKHPQENNKTKAKNENLPAPKAKSVPQSSQVQPEAASQKDPKSEATAKVESAKASSPTKKDHSKGQSKGQTAAKAAESDDNNQVGKVATPQTTTVETPATKKDPKKNKKESSEAAETPASKPTEGPKDSSPKIIEDKSTSVTAAVTKNIPDSTKEKKVIDAGVSPTKNDKKEQNQSAKKETDASSKKDCKPSSASQEKSEMPATIAEASTSEVQPETKSTDPVSVVDASTNAAPEATQKPKKKKIVLRKVKPADSVSALPPSESTAEEQPTVVVKKIVKKIIRRVEPSSTTST